MCNMDFAFGNALVERPGIPQTKNRRLNERKLNTGRRNVARTKLAQTKSCRIEW